MLIRMPTAEPYALKVPKEQTLLPQLAPYLTLNIPTPLRIGTPSENFPFPFSIYKWLAGTSINLLSLDDDSQEKLAVDLAKFLIELQNIQAIPGPAPGQHNWWRGDHISVYDQDARAQITKLQNIIDADKAIHLWKAACKTRWPNPPVWIHGDIAIGNLLMNEGKLTAIIDFGGASQGDPACDLVIAWTYFKNQARDLFIEAIGLDKDTWLRAKAWALWKATYELCQIADKNNPDITIQKKIIFDVLSD